jgi:hypothetical protein
MKEKTYTEQEVIAKLQRALNWSRKRAIEHLEKEIREGRLTPTHGLTKEERRNFRLRSGLH